MITVVDYYADWCGPCKMMTPVLDELEKELEGKVKFEKVNVDVETQKASAAGVMSIPTFVVLDASGKEIDRLIGYVPKEEFQKKIEAHM
jgi:thioredoxin 1